MVTPHAYLYIWVLHVEAPIITAGVELNKELITICGLGGLFLYRQDCLQGCTEISNLYLHWFAAHTMKPVNATPAGEWPNLQL